MEMDIRIKLEQDLTLTILIFMQSHNQNRKKLYFLATICTMLIFLANVK